MGLMLGIDTGGTSTDAVVMDEAGSRVLATAKVPTTHGDLVFGIGAAVEAVLAGPAVTAEAIGLVSLSTTLATNALVEGQGEPACLVLAGFGHREVERITTDAGDDRIHTVAGGHDAQGRPLAAVDVGKVTRLARETADEVSGYAVATQFSVRNPAHELEIASVLGETSGHPVTCSHELSSRLDGPRRATTALLNARLIGLVARLEASVRRVLTEAGIDGPLMVVRGDGSLVSADYVSRRPIETVLSGPAASVVGGRFLTVELVGATDMIVADIGGTTTDLAALRDGEPVLNPEGAVVAGHRTMVRAVDLSTHGIGGDSEVVVDRGGLAIGPARAIPLCRLAEGHPEVLDQLRDQLGAASSQRHGRFLLALTSATQERSLTDLDENQRRLLELVTTEGPVPEQVAVTASRELVALDRLRRRSLIRVATLTPTDAALVLGPSAGSSSAVTGLSGGQACSEVGAEAARLGAELLARRLPADAGSGGSAAGALARASPADTGSGRSAATALARRVYESLVAQSADQVLDVALRVDGLGATAADDPLLRAAIAGHRGFIDLSAGLNVPLVAVGAAAGAYYPAVAGAVGTEAVVPAHAAVANAVGAVVGPVRIRRELTISRPRAGRYELHGVMLADGEPRAFRSLEEARAAAEEILADDVAYLARSAGAVETEMVFDWSARTATVGGRDLLVEATLGAVASGRPGFARGREIR
ncbi:MAG: hydantoinase/oxoprolinase family protein [Acidimicrobiia bacterium]|nr:hydantoinase/oxoprolinase family protein [Acidimicrobiia bacterium]